MSNNPMVDTGETDNATGMITKEAFLRKAAGFKSQMRNLAKGLEEVSDILKKPVDGAEDTDKKPGISAYSDKHLVYRKLRQVCELRCPHKGMLGNGKQCSYCCVVNIINHYAEVVEEANRLLEESYKFPNRPVCREVVIKNFNWRD